MTEREQIEKAADRIRDELLLTLQELDRRREHALDVRYQVHQHEELLKSAGGVLVLLAGVGISYAIWRARHREERLRRMRWEGVKRAWSHPERLARRHPERPVSQELGKKLVLIFASTLASAIAKRSVSTLVPAGPEKAPARA